MQTVTFDATSVGVGDGTSRTVAHTVTGQNSVLLVGVHQAQQEADLCTGVTYNTVAMTRVATKTHAGVTNRLYLYALPIANPDGASHDIVASFSSSVTTCYVRGISYKFCKQEQPEANATAESYMSATLAVAVTPVTNNAFVTSVFGSTNTSGTAGAGTTLRADGSPKVFESSSNPIATPASTTLNVGSIDTNPAWSALIISVSLAGTNYSPKSYSFILD
jgi:hypothetical protein